MSRYEQGGEEGRGNFATAIGISRACVRGFWDDSSRLSASLSFVIRSENDILSDRAERRSVGRAEREVGTYRDGEGRTVLPTRDQHRREIASNLWVRLITGECSSFDSPLFLRPQLHQTSFQRRGEPPPLLYRHRRPSWLSRSLSLSSRFNPLSAPHPALPCSALLCPALPCEPLCAWVSQLA